MKNTTTGRSNHTARHRTHTARHRTHTARQRSIPVENWHDPKDDRIKHGLLTHGAGAENKGLASERRQGITMVRTSSSETESGTPFGEWFARTRAYFRIQQIELLAALDYKAQSAISNLERGKRLPKTREQADRIIDGLLGCQATRILSQSQRDALRTEGLAAWAQSHVGSDFVSVTAGARPGTSTIQREGTLQRESDPDRQAYMAAFDKLSDAEERSRLREIAEIYVSRTAKE